MFAGRVRLFSLEIKVEGFCTTDSNGRKSYTKGRVIKWDVEVGSFSFDLLMQSLRNELKWSPLQSPCLWIFDKRMCEDVRLVNDLQMEDLFEMYKEQMQCEVVVGIFDKEIADADEFADLEPLEFIPPNNQEPIWHDSPHHEQLITPDIDIPIPPDAEQPIPSDADPNGGTEYPPDREPDIFDNEEEYVGFDDEGMYMPVPDTQNTNNAGPANNNGGGAAGGSNNAGGGCGSNNAAAEGGFSLEAEVDDADPLEVHVIHDPENPKIIKGAQYPDIITFRKAIRHFAVKKGFEFAKLKTDKTRFIAQCKGEGCPWRIHASRIWDDKTIEVIMSVMLYFSCFLSLCNAPFRI